MPFDFKLAMKDVTKEASGIQDPKARQVFIETKTKELKAHAEMLKNMSQFVNSKDKNR